jgi:hypothetical protein
MVRHRENKRRASASSADHELLLDVLRGALARIATTHPMLAPFVPAIVGLTATAPEERWPLARLQTFLRGGLDTPTM